MYHDIIVIIVPAMIIQAYYTQARILLTILTSQPARKCGVIIKARHLFAL